MFQYCEEGHCQPPFVWLAAWDKTFEELDFMLNIESEFYLTRNNGQGNITVTEGYKKAPEFPFTVQTVATWSQNDGMQILQHHEKYERRSNLSGVKLNIASLENVIKCP